MQPTRPSKADQQKWEAEDALHTLERTKEIEKNGPLMRRVQRLAKQKAEETARIAPELAKKGK